MNILIVTQYFWPEAFRINDVARGMRDRGHDVRVLTGMPNYPAGQLYQGYGRFTPAREQFDEIPVVRAPLVTRGKSRNWRLALNYLSFALSASVVGPLRCRGPIDAVLVYEPSPVTVGLPGIVMGTIKRAPALLWIQDLWPETLEAVGVPPGSVPARVAGYVSDWIHRHCDLLLLQSRAYEAKLAARGFNVSRMEYLPNWAEQNFRPLESDDVAEDPMSGIDGFRIVFAGNIGSAQSFETVVDAATRLRDRKDIKWVIVGEGNVRGWLESEIAKRGLEETVILMGWHAPERMPAFFGHADVLLVTLRSDSIFSLTVPSKVQTYLACGKPILAALNGEGAAILEQSGAGVVGPAENGLALADGALRLAGMDAAERRLMGRAGRAYFEANFDRARLLDRLESAIERLVTQRAHTHTRR
ncbi:MAG: glycosyltransferase [Betaproteobacteria bacterium]|nr:glycosyltransferase [Betaproteobacteria bacterium]